MIPAVEGAKESTVPVAVEPVPTSASRRPFRSCRRFTKKLESNCRNSVQMILNLIGTTGKEASDLLDKYYSVNRCFR